MAVINCDFCTFWAESTVRQIKVLNYNNALLMFLEPITFPDIYCALTRAFNVKNDILLSLRHIPVRLRKPLYPVSTKIFDHVVARSWRPRNLN
mgnify:CR=1 FL=1